MNTKNTRIKPELISFLTIRRSIGILGIGLPFALLIFSYIFGCEVMQPSISHYYYTSVGALFVGILSAVGLFLISYKGFSALDDFATNLAGFCAFGIAFFATSKPIESACIIVGLSGNSLREILHYVSAAVFFLTLSYISFFLFTKSKGTKTKKKVIRNRIYRVCAVLMLIFVVLIFITDKLIKVSDHLHLTFWLEWGALISFGFSWLIKGETFFKG
ncbi:hypothetical protein [Pedobacter caeni]|uniref:DUF998 domain-containing protein n=1 Tax=Pedobacter caeni TaxID=288992 RepID=A0A1M5B1P6_9SPHI|nr:hypothetical protein [Pedobacter caeni]SHF36336.1 hypothetical protein SAMN04488522_102980 [Pedobacter caeni]